ncbi:MAG: hypothetical protein M3Z01_04765 [Thermoproteota archaeon]|nr:hypothetical protein [Thermoproteota archaeon]
MATSAINICIVIPIEYQACCVPGYKWYSFRTAVTMQIALIQVVDSFMSDIHSY